MSEESNIDKLFRDKLYNRNFDFNQEHWEKMEKLIDGQEKKKHWFGGGKAILISLTIILAGIGGYFILNNTSGNYIAEQKLPESETIQASEAATPTNAENTQAEGENTQAEIESVQAEIESVHAEIESVHAKSESIHAKSESVHAERESVHAERESVHAKRESVHAESESVHAKGESVHAETKSVKAKTETVNKGITSAKAKTEPAQAKTENTSAKDESANKTTETQQATNENAQNTVEKKEEEMTISEPELFLLDRSVITQNKENDPITKQVKKKKPSELQYPIFTELPAEPETKPEKDRLNWLRHVSLGVSGGANTSLGMTNTGTAKAKPTVRPIGGLRIAYQLNEEVDIETGFLYDYRSGLNSSIKTLTSADPTTNTNYFSTEKTLSLHYIDIPFHLTYKAGEKTSFVIGMQYAQVITTYSEISDTKEETGNTTVLQTSEQWNKNDERFSSMDLATTLGLEFSVTEKIRICARYNLGLFDVTDDTSFGNSVRDSNRQFRILLDYRFLKY